MKIIGALLVSMLLTGTTCLAQTSAITAEGAEVILYKDGTWKYLNSDEAESSEIRTSKTQFQKNREATFQVKSNIISGGIYLNPKKWSFKKSDKAEYEFQSKQKGRDVYGMLISERIEIPLESLKEIALENARQAAPDTKIAREEYRVVNGTKVLCMQMDGTIKGIRFSYLGYYYSYANGTLQFITFTAQNLLKEYQSDMEELLNGLVLQNVTDTKKEPLKSELSK
jgi:hypothetical protein